MKKTSYLPFVLLMFFLFSILSISESQTQKIRAYAISSISPFWISFGNFFSLAKAGSGNVKVDEKINKNVELENALLKDQLDSVYKWLMFDQRIDVQFDTLKEVSSNIKDEFYWKDFFRRRAEELKKILDVELQSLPAKIIFREPTSWSSSIWINVGEKNNDELGRLLVGKNSPVVVGDSIVGVVEFVGKSQSRVRLITDSGLVPSVRAVRGSVQDRDLLQVSYELFERLYSRQDLFQSDEEKDIFIQSISTLINRLKEKRVDYYLAKGELHGNSYPLWRSYGQRLKGTGFNYDYSDEEGPSREIITGKTLDKNFEFLNQALLEKGDLLITTGMDGVFPSGLKVAIVSEVKEFQEGDYSYDIEAIPTARGLSNLNMVFVLPPLGLEKD